MRCFLFLAMVLTAGCGAPEPPPQPAPAPPAQIPHSMKGYTLYGWTRGGRDVFALITGTNRLKSFDELDDPEPVEAADGWVHIRVEGVDRAEELLRRVPADDFVMVQSVRHVSVAQPTVPGDVGDPDEVLLDRLRAAR